VNPLADKASQAYTSKAVDWQGQRAPRINRIITNLLFPFKDNTLPSSVVQQLHTYKRTTGDATPKDWTGLLWRL